jgi:two-component system response regulator FixJ
MEAEPEIYVVDDDPHLRDALELLLGTAGIKVRSFESAEAMIDALPPEKPVCALVDLIMPGMGGLGLVRELARRQRASSVIVVTAYGDVPMAVEAMRAGAMHFIEKPFEPETLLDLIGEAMQRTRQLAQEQEQIHAARESIAALTTREREVLQLLAEGSPNKVIAATLDISIRTTEHHRAAVMRKMGARTISQLIRTLLLAQPPNLTRL